MHKKLKLLAVNLRLFDGGAAGAAAGTQGGAASAPASGQQGESQGAGGAPVYQSKRAKKGGEPVLYGVQGAAVEADSTMEQTPAAEGKPEDARTIETTSNTLEEKRKAFDDLVNGDYKDQFSERIQAILNRRLKDAKGVQERLEAQEPLMQLLAQKYQTDDPKRLTEAIEGDRALWEAAAEKAGMTVDQFKQVQRMMRENQQLRQESQKRQADIQAQQMLQQWEQQGRETQAAYPEFNLRAELQNPDFIRLLKAGTPVRHAYEVLHMQDIMVRATQQAAKTTEKQVVDNIRAKGQRPQENGTLGQSGVTVKTDVTKFTRADRAAIARQAARGEKIVL